MPRLLLAIRKNPGHVTWRRRFRPALDGPPVPPSLAARNSHPSLAGPQLPLWLGVGGTLTSMERAGQLGLPMILGLTGGDIRCAPIVLDLDESLPP